MLRNSAMLKLLKNQYLILKRCFSAHNDTLLAQSLKNRSVLRLSGSEAGAYLQGLVTNDMKHLQDGASSMFAMFLNSKGRVLYDSIIYKGENENTFYIECDAIGALSLRDHLLRYKVRRKVSVDSLKNEMNVWSVVNAKNMQNADTSHYKVVCDMIKKGLKDSIVVQDPRLSTLGIRVLTKNVNLCTEIKKNSDVDVKEENFYKLLRYKLGIGEGTKELPFEKCFPMEANVDYLHGISFHKGCYIGQELTARTYHTGVIRKRLMPLVFEEDIKISENGIPIFVASQSNKSVGKLQGTEQNNGVGLLRIAEALNAEELMVLNKKCRTHRPRWWPNEAPKERMNI